ncbi:MAG: acetyl-CoA C-acyltransferase [Sphingorhabdus sp.]
MRDAVIVSTARTAIGKAYRGGFNATLGPTLGSYSLKAAVERAGIEGGEIDDVLWGSALQQGTQGGNLARQVALRAGLPISVSGMTMDRQCSSGLMSIATAAKQIIVDNVDVMAAGGQDSISLVQTKEMRVQADPELVAMHNSIYMPMLQTAEVVAKRYNISRDAMDEYALQSQQRTAAGQAAGYFDAEIVPVTTIMNVVNKETGEVSQKEVTIAKDEGNRADTQLAGLQGLQPVLGPDMTITAGNASQLSDGSSASILMEAKVAEKKGLNPLGRYVGMAVAGTEPDEMGIGPVFAIPKLLQRFGLKMDDIGIWELNEAFASVVLRFMEAMGVDHTDINVNGGAIAMGHPLGATGAMILGTVLDELERSGKSTALTTLCIGAGMGTATIIERVN